MCTRPALAEKSNTVWLAAGSGRTPSFNDNSALEKLRVIWHNRYHPRRGSVWVGDVQYFFDYVSIAALYLRETVTSGPEMDSGSLKCRRWNVKGNSMVR